jgi:hypothetical protein
VKARTTGETPVPPSTVHITRGQTTAPTSVWQDERFDRWIRDENEFAEKWQYIADNPVKRGLAASAADYPWLFLLEETPRLWG